MDFALSTSWNAYRYTKAKELIFEIKEIGFNKVELSFNLTTSMVKDIASLVRAGEIEVVSLHNFCPIPLGIKRELALPDYYSMASPDQTARKKAVQQTKKTIETAGSLGAKAVVLHCGRVEIPDPTREMINLWKKDGRQTNRFLRLKDTALRQRKLLAPFFLDNTLKSLDELAGYAANHGIKLGIENRFYFREIPSFEEIDRILREFRGSAIYYWHDTGHAQIMENLGFARHSDFLLQYSKHLLGAHLHNVIGCADHQAPLKGEIDFSLFKKYLKKSTLKIVEAHRQASAAELKASLNYLKGAL